MKIIYPFSPYKPATWNNWSNYLFWSSNSIDSIQDYLDYFNPNFYILNETLSYNPSNTWIKKDYDIKDTEKCWYAFGAEEDKTYFCIPGNLRWRQGILNPNVNAYACLDTSCFEEEINIGDAISLDEAPKKYYQLSTSTDLKTAIAENKMYKIPSSTVIFAKQWVNNGLFQYNNDQTKDINHYQFISLPIAALFLPNNISKGFSFKYIENGQTVLGENISFAFEFFPARYFHTDNTSNKWSNNAISYTTQGAIWSKPTAPIQKIIENINGQVWTNSYPLMHECRIKTTNEYATEEFIVDNDFNIQNINIANHATVLYTINTRNISQEETSNWNNFVRVFIL